MHDAMLDIRALQAAYRAGVATATMVVQQHLTRIERLDSRLNAFIDIDHAGAARTAAECDARIAAGEPRALEGVPIAVKANIAVAGLEWSAGMAARRGIVARTDADVVAQLRAAGCVVLGTLNMHEAALGATTDNPWFGRAANPHGLDRTPGGSSGGSAAAVAAGLCVVALGTDTLGSVRIPAAYNGVYGLKPTQGRISNRGLVLLARELDTIGPLARSLDDLAALLPILEAPAAPHPPLARVILLQSPEEPACEPSVTEAHGRALAALAPLPLVRVRLPDSLARIRLAGFMTAARELADCLGETCRGNTTQISPELARLLQIATAREPADRAADQAALDRAKEILRAALGRDGVVLLPTAPQAAFAHTARPPVTQADFTALANIAGLPALSLPAGFDADGLPVAVQLIGPPDSEAELIALGRMLDERLRGYRPPPIN